MSLPSALVRCALRRRPVVAVRVGSSLRAVATQQGPSASPAVPRLNIPSVRFAPPSALSHEGLAYLACPVCGSSHHLAAMYAHLTGAHTGLNPAHCRRICDERLELYRRTVGAPLELPKERAAERATAALAPSVSARGYQCNWCVHRERPHPTRDAFLKHVLLAHPELDLDEVEACTPALAAPAATTVGNNAPPRQPPSQRMSAARPPPVEEDAPQVRLGPRIATVSIPRNADSSLPSEGVARAPEAEAVFSEGNFPCELCNKSFATELNLLQHLEGRHPTGEADADGSADDRAAKEEVAEFTRAEATAGLSGGTISVVCDLCSSSRIYTLPSALFAHIRFKHPAEDAAFQVNRLIEKHQHAGSVRTCPHCQRPFASEAALAAHVQDKHTAPTAAGSPASGAQSAALLPAVSPKLRWWCHDCEKGFGQAKALHGHMISKHQIVSQVFPCPACKRVFGDVFSLIEHIGMQHKSIDAADLGLETQVECPECTRLFLSHEELHKHMVRHHGKDPAQPVRALRKPLTASTTEPRTAVAPQDSNNTAAAATNTTTSVTTAPLSLSPDAAKAISDTVAAPLKPRKVARKK